MSEHQLHTLNISPKTGEPFLRLPYPHNTIIITPPRLSDVEPLVTILNDPKIYHWMSGPPNPYLLEHGVEWIMQQKKETDAILRDLDSGPPRKEFALGCPVRIIRELRVDGTDEYLGYLGIYRSERKDIDDDDERKRVLKGDENRSPGDPKIVWDMADYLKPSHHGKGIMSAAIATIISQWAIPYLNSHIIRASTFQENKASLRVLEKAEFVKTKEACEGVRGEMRGVHWLEWNRDSAVIAVP